MRSSPSVVVGETEGECVVGGERHLGRGVSRTVCLEATRVVVNRSGRSRVQVDFDDEADGRRVAAQVTSEEQLAIFWQRIFENATSVQKTESSTRIPAVCLQHSSVVPHHGPRYPRRLSGIVELAYPADNDCSPRPTRMIIPKPRAGSSKFTQFSIWLTWTL